MSSEILFCAMFLLLLVGFATILWFFFGHVKKRRRPHKKEIFICGDCWLLVFDFLTPSQLGLEIAMISHRFDRIVDEHFKTRKWKLGEMRICHKIEENGTKQMQIVKSDANPLPIPQNPLPNKVIGFRSITIEYIDQNVIAFLRLFHRFFPVCKMDLYIITGNDRISEFILLNIWPILRDFIIRLRFNTIAFRRLRQLAPSFLNDSPSLRYVFFEDAFEQIKAAFSNASSPVTFRILFLMSSPIDFILPFDLINEVTGEKLTFKQSENDYWLSRCPIGWDERNWENVWEELSVQQNRINIRIRDGAFDGGLSRRRFSQAE